MPNYMQAREFSAKVAARNKHNFGMVTEYDLPDEALEELKVLRFPTVPNTSWLEFVVSNRSGRYDGEKYDLIIGPVANDNVYRTIGLYMTGVLSQRAAIEDLKVRELFSQVVFASEKALSALRYVREERIP